MEVIEPAPVLTSHWITVSVSSTKFWIVTVFVVPANVYTILEITSVPPLLCTFKVIVVDDSSSSHAEEVANVSVTGLKIFQVPSLPS